MEVCGITSFHSSSSWIVTEKKGIAIRQPNVLRCSQSIHQIPSQTLLKSKAQFQCRGKHLSKFVDFQLSSCFSATEAETLSHAPIDDVALHLSGHCSIYLVGMMGSGKTTIGKILAESLGYSFLDTDKLVEQAEGASVTQIMKECGEKFFRDIESEVLRGLSFMNRLVVATGGGAVIKRRNWNYMKQGIPVWLDVPLEILASRIAADGTNSRPLLGNSNNALQNLSGISKGRAGMYENAMIRVSLESIASKMDLGDISDLTPTAIAIEALVQIDNFLKERPTFEYDGGSEADISKV